MTTCPGLTWTSLDFRNGPHHHQYNDHIRTTAAKVTSSTARAITQSVSLWNILMNAHQNHSASLFIRTCLHRWIILSASGYEGEWVTVWHSDSWPIGNRCSVWEMHELCSVWEYVSYLTISRLWRCARAPRWSSARPWLCVSRMKRTQTDPLWGWGGWGWGLSVT